MCERERERESERAREREREREIRLPFFRSYLLLLTFAEKSDVYTKIWNVWIVYERNSWGENVLRCYNRTRFFPTSEYSIWCKANETFRGPEGNEYVITCCDHVDFCNRDLRPSFPKFFAERTPRGTHQYKHISCKNYFNTKTAYVFRNFILYEKN